MITAYEVSKNPGAVHTALLFRSRTCSMVMLIHEHIA